jgi:Uncharacterized protein conserved in bacteria (DUF2330)
MRRTTWVRVGLAAMALGVVLADAGTARACGGTFCDGVPPGQPPMPVDQTGENVLFVMSAGFVEAHIQIQYQGDPARFAWIIPVQKTPELSVGSEILFVNLLNATVPTFTLTSSSQGCGSGSSGSSSSGAGCGASSDSTSASSFGAPKTGGTDTDAPKVAARNTVGNFETVTLQPTSAQGLLDWLTQNGYESDAADALPELQYYVGKGYVFVAVKLVPNAGVDEIHPLVVRYPGNEPCVPLRLTRVAAVDDMTVRTFFLGENRVVPTGAYKQVTLNPAQLDWIGLGKNYNLAVSRAVDTPVADGHAFITEYAGPSSAVDKTGIYSASWSSAPFATETPEQALAELTSQGLLSCSSASSCSAAHPLVFPLLERYLPPPAGVSDADYYSCLSCYPTADQSLWDGNLFAADYQTLISGPAQHAVDVLQNHLYLTRMVTRISPAEMTADPTFVEWATPIGDVSNQLAATRVSRCDGSAFVNTSDGRLIEGTGAPAALPTDMPWAEKVEEFDASGQVLTLVDNGESIDQKLLAYDADKAPARYANPSSDSGGGCGCVLQAKNAPHGLAIGLLGALGLLRRVARRRSRRTPRS